jgi:hypothetical protein
MGSSPTSWPSGSIQYIPESISGYADLISLHDLLMSFSLPRTLVLIDVSLEINYEITLNKI